MEDDLISRKNVLDIIDNWFACGDIADGKPTMRLQVKALPSVASIRPKGRWIFIHPLQEDDDGAYICSNCKHGDWDCDTSYKYCPFCGADMTGEDEL